MQQIYNAIKHKANIFMIILPNNANLY